MKNKQKKRFADWLIEPANGGCSLSTDAFDKISENVPKQGSRDLYRFKTASQGSGF